MANIEVLNKSNIQNTPVKSGWYLCICSRSSVLYCSYHDNFNQYESDVDYRICNCKPRLLYWEENVWLTHPRSFNTIESYNVLKWMELPSEFDFVEKKIQVKEK